MSKEKILPSTTTKLETFITSLADTPMDPYQTAHDTSNAMAGQYMQELKKVIEKHKHLTDHYVIVAYTRRSLPTEKVIHTTFVARHSLPIPEWKTAAYRVDNKINSIHLVWALPDEAEARQIVKRPDLFDKKLVQDCNLVLSKKNLDDNLFKTVEVKL